MPDPAVTTHTVLIVDDDSTSRRIMLATLKRQGLIVVEAANGQEAVRLFAQTHADIVLMDASMPRMDGYTAAAKIRASEFGAEVPIIMVSSFADSDSVKKAKAAGVTEYVTKPVNWTLLNSLVKSHLTAAV